MKALVRTLAAAALVAAAAPVQAAITFTVNLTTSQEPGAIVPTTSTGQPRPTPFGTATFTLNDALTAMTFTATVSNLDFTGTQTADTFDNLIAAHIHAGTALSAAGTYPVVWGFFGSPFNDNNPNDVVVSPFATGVGGTITGKWDAPEGNGTTLTAQLPNILAGNSYINSHTTQFAGGETRGFLQVVPEPSSVLLFSAGLGGLLAVGIQKRRRTQAAPLKSN